MGLNIRLRRLGPHRRKRVALRRALSPSSWSQGGKGSAKSDAIQFPIKVEFYLIQVLRLRDKGSGFVLCFRAIPWPT